MRELEVIKGKLILLKEHELTKDNRRRTIRMPWTTIIETVDKRLWRVTTRQYYRHKPQKPYVPEGFVEVNGERFKVVEK